jgi:ATP-dependent DNA ligase
VKAARKNRYRQLVIDGEAVVVGVDGVADFNALHLRKQVPGREINVPAVIGPEAWSLAEGRQ